MQAIIDWITKDEGGRTKPPLGEGMPPYAAVIRFKDTNQPSPPVNGWRLVVKKVDEIGPHKWMADVHFLVPEAPKELLTRGRGFELYEGSKCVAFGEIL